MGGEQLEHCCETNCLILSDFWSLGWIAGRGPVARSQHGTDFGCPGTWSGAVSALPADLRWPCRRRLPSRDRAAATAAVPPAAAPAASPSPREAAEYTAEERVNIWVYEQVNRAW